MALNHLIFQGSDTKANLGGPLDFWDTVEWFIQHKESDGCSPETIKYYRWQLGYFRDFIVTPEDPHVTLDEITDEVVVAYLTHLRNRDNRRRTGTKVSSWTVKTAFTAIRAFFRWCAKPPRKYIKAAPTEGLVAKATKIIKPALPEGTRERMLAVCPQNTFVGARNRAIIEMLWTTPARRKEIACLSLENLEWKLNRIKVLGKGDKERYMMFLPSAKKAVLHYLDFRRKRASRNEQALWVSEEGRPMTLGSIQQIMKRTAERAEVQYRDVCHAWRRTWTMRQLAAGVGLKPVQLIGGWNNFAAMEPYIRAMESQNALSQKWV
jgi:site-specific recombinase XerD